MRIWKATGNFIRHRYGSPVPNTPQSKKNTPYDNPVSAASGCGTLRYRTGEYYALLILYAVVMFLFFGLTVFSGKSISGTLQIIREEKLYGALFFPVVFVGTVLALFYVSLQKITYDREKIVISRFPAGHKPCCAGISASLNVPPAVRGSGRSPCTRITADM